MIRAVLDAEGLDAVTATPRSPGLERPVRSGIRTGGRAAMAADHMVRRSRLSDPRLWQAARADPTSVSARGRELAMMWLANQSRASRAAAAPVLARK